jgi:hypothetical protein
MTSMFVKFDWFSTFYSQLDLLRFCFLEARYPVASADFCLIVQDLKTDDNGIAKFQEVAFTTPAGPCMSSLKNAIIK